jgi:diacylglycerol kinase (ATP)
MRFLTLVSIKEQLLMKTANILHNPKAGEREFTKKKLLKLMEASGFNCSYSSTKKRGWEKIEPADTDFVILAGGDGTVRKVAGELLDKKLPIGLIPLGTANNIAKTLGISGTLEDIIEAWSHKNIKKYDVGRIYGLKKAAFFLEGFGYGVFPRLMKEMHSKSDKQFDSPEKNLNKALEVMHDIILSSKARHCKIAIDGADYSGRFLLAEVMNTQSIGPNLNLAPFADPGDGSFEVILISERQREEFANYVHNKLNGIEQPPIFNILKARNLEIYWEGKLLHVDDEIIELKEPAEVRIKLQEGVLEFLVPDQATESQRQTGYAEAIKR